MKKTRHKGHKKQKLGKDMNDEFKAAANIEDNEVKGFVYDIYVLARQANLSRKKLFSLKSKNLTLNQSKDMLEKTEIMANELY